MACGYNESSEQLPSPPFMEEKDLQSGFHASSCRAPLLTVRCNLTRNTCVQGRHLHEKFEKLRDAKDLDGLLAAYGQCFPYAKHRQRCQTLLTRGALLHAFQNGRASLAFNGKCLAGPNECQWLQTRIVMMENPDTGDIEAMLFADSIDAEHFAALFENQFNAPENDFVAFIDTHSGALDIICCKENALPPANTYAETLEAMLSQLLAKRDVPRAMEELSLEAVRQKLEKHPRLIRVFEAQNGSADSGAKKWVFFCPEANPCEIVLIQSDLSAMHGDEGDSVTGVYTRSAFYRHVRKLLLERPQDKYALMVLDLDRFKVYNDLFGRNAGDRLLAAIGKKIRQDFGFGARLETDRFAILMPADTDFIKVTTDQRRWLANFRPDYEVSSRYGVCPVPNPSADLNAVCDRALLALQSIKNNSETFFAWYNDSMRSKLIQEQQLEHDIREGLDKDEFIVYLQPQYDIVSGEMTGAETLVRWQTPSKGILSPNEFIPLMEQKGLITRLDFVMFEKACLLLKKWKENGSPMVPLSVNLSRRDIYTPKLHDQLCGIAEKYGIDRTWLRLEVTETAYMENPEQAIGALKLLRKEGFLIEMDDFGSGYSSLNTLKTMPVDILKLDLKFLADSFEGRGGIILNSVVQMAHWLNLRVIAEGVETARQADYLKTIGCRYVQGYFYARPLPVETFETLLKQQSIKKMASDMTIAHFFDSKEFWNPDAQATIIFNTFVGAAGIFTYDTNSLIPTRLNDRFFEITDASRETLSKHKNILDYAAPDDREKIIAALEKACCSDREVDIESRWIIPRLNCRLVWIHARVRRIATSPKNYIFYIDLENITERRMLIEKNQKLTDDLSSLFRGVPCGIAKAVHHGDTLDITYASDGLCRMLGFTREEFIQKFHEPPAQRVYPDDIQNFTKFKQEMISERGPLTGQFRLRCKNESYIWVDLKANPFEVPQVGHVYYLSYTDITSIKDMEQQLLSEKEKTDFVLENSTISIWSYDLPTKICCWHYGMKGDFWTEHSRIADMPDSLIRQGVICKDSIDDYKALYKSIARGEKKAEGIIHFRKADGTEMWQKITYHTTFHDKKPVGAIGFSINVTTEQEKEQRYLREMKFLEEVHSDNLIDKSRINITRDLVENYTACTGVILPRKDTSYTAMHHALVDTAFTQSQKKFLGQELSRENLNRQYNRLNRHLRFEFQRVPAPGSKPIWSELSIKLYQDPQRGDIMAFLYSYDINERKLIHAVMNKIYGSGFSMIGLLDRQDGTLHTYQVSRLEADAGMSQDIRYTEVLPLLVQKYIPEENRKEALNALSLETIIARLAENPRYACSYSVILDGHLCRKKWECTYLDDDKNQILFTRTDITELFLQQTTQKPR